MDERIIEQKHCIFFKATLGSEPIIVDRLFISGKLYPNIPTSPSISQKSYAGILIKTLYQMHEQSRGRQTPKTTNILRSSTRFWAFKRWI